MSGAFRKHPPTDVTPLSAHVAGPQLLDRFRTNSVSQEESPNTYFNRNEVIRDT